MGARESACCLRRLEADERIALDPRMHFGDCVIKHRRPHLLRLVQRPGNVQGQDEFKRRAAVDKGIQDRLCLLDQLPILDRLDRLKLGRGSPPPRGLHYKEHVLLGVLALHKAE